ncbi:hypothetical protein Pelo_5886 [Pelomyxa schiedti]|nr:hypothetical protein Pelo_5886 [Pelomyxa schiedti]
MDGVRSGAPIMWLHLDEDDDQQPKQLPPRRRPQNLKQQQSQAPIDSPSTATSTMTLSLHLDEDDDYYRPQPPPPPQNQVAPAKQLLGATHDDGDDDAGAAPPEKQQQQPSHNDGAGRETSNGGSGSHSESEALKPSRDEAVVGQPNATNDTPLLMVNATCKDEEVDNDKQKEKEKEKDNEKDTDNSKENDNGNSNQHSDNDNDSTKGKDKDMDNTEQDREEGEKNLCGGSKAPETGPLSLHLSLEEDDEGHVPPNKDSAVQVTAPNAPNHVCIPDTVSGICGESTEMVDVCPSAIGDKGRLMEEQVPVVGSKGSGDRGLEQTDTKDASPSEHKGEPNEQRPQHLTKDGVGLILHLEPSQAPVLHSTQDLSSKPKIDLIEDSASSLVNLQVTQPKYTPIQEAQGNIPQTKHLDNCTQVDDVATQPPSQCSANPPFALSLPDVRPEPQAVPFKTLENGWTRKEKKQADDQAVGKIPPEPRSELLVRKCEERTEVVHPNAPRTIKSSDRDDIEWQTARGNRKPECDEDQVKVIPPKKRRTASKPEKRNSNDLWEKLGIDKPATQSNMPGLIVMHNMTPKEVVVQSKKFEPTKQAKTPQGSDSAISKNRPQLVSDDAKMCTDSDSHRSTHISRKNDTISPVDSTLPKSTHLKEGNSRVTEIRKEKDATKVKSCHARKETKKPKRSKSKDRSRSRSKSKPRTHKESSVTSVDENINTPHPKDSTKCTEPTTTCINEEPASPFEPPSTFDMGSDDLIPAQQPICAADGSASMKAVDIETKEPNPTDEVSRPSSHKTKTTESHHAIEERNEETATTKTKNTHSSSKHSETLHHTDEGTSTKKRNKKKNKSSSSSEDSSYRNFKSSSSESSSDSSSSSSSSDSSSVSLPKKRKTGYRAKKRKIHKEKCLKHESPTLGDSDEKVHDLHDFYPLKNAPIDWHNVQISKMLFSAIRIVSLLKCMLPATERVHSLIERCGAQILPTLKELHYVPSKTAIPYAVLLASAPSEEIEYLLALAKGIPILHYNWVLRSVSKGSLARPHKFLLPRSASSPSQDTHTSFEPLNVFEKLRIEVLGPNSAEWQDLVHSAGGVPVSRLFSDNGHIDVVLCTPGLITIEHHVKQRIKKLGLKMVSHRWAMDCLFGCRKVDFDTSGYAAHPTTMKVHSSDNTTSGTPASRTTRRTSPRKTTTTTKLSVGKKVCSSVTPKAPQKISCGHVWIGCNRTSLRIYHISACWKPRAIDNRHHPSGTICTTTLWLHISTEFYPSNFLPLWAGLYEDQVAPILAVPTLTDLDLTSFPSGIPSSVNKVASWISSIHVRFIIEILREIEYPLANPSLVT